jgi:hypothetical protein
VLVRIPPAKVGIETISAMALATKNFFIFSSLFDFRGQRYDKITHYANFCAIFRYSEDEWNGFKRN